jgi:hypothetical protein
MKLFRLGLVALFTSLSVAAYAGEGCGGCSGSKESKKADTATETPAPAEKKA